MRKWVEGTFMMAAMPWLQSNSFLDRELGINLTPFNTNMLDWRNNKWNDNPNRPVSDWRQYLLTYHYSVTADSAQGTEWSIRRTIPTLEFLRFDGGIYTVDSNSKIRLNDGTGFSGAKTIGFNPFNLINYSINSIQDGLLIDNVQDAIDSISQRVSMIVGLRNIMDIEKADTNNMQLCGTITTAFWQSQGVQKWTSKFYEPWYPRRSAIFGGDHDVFRGENLLVSGRGNYINNDSKTETANSLIVGLENRVLCGKEHVDDEIRYNLTSSILAGQYNETHNNVPGVIIGGEGNIVSDSGLSVVGGQGNYLTDESWHSALFGAGNGIFNGSTASFIAGHGNMITDISVHSVIFGGGNGIHNNSVASFIAGVGNFITGISAQSVIFGAGNKIHNRSVASFIAGSGNKIVGTGSAEDGTDGGSVNSAAFGAGNEIANRSVQSFVAGGGNTITGSVNSAAFGMGNSISYSAASFAAGAANGIASPHSAVFGVGNRIGHDSAQSFVAGSDNFVSGPQSAVFGAGNKIYDGSNMSFIAGGGNLIIDSRHSFIGGWGSEIAFNSVHSAAFGVGNYIHNSSHAAFIAGAGNYITGNSAHAVAFGAGNRIHNNSIGSFIAGAGSYITDSSVYSAIFGCGNTIANRSTQSFAAGTGNIIATGSVHSSVFGAGNKMTETSSQSFIAGGGNLITFSEASAIFGRDNMINNYPRTAYLYHIADGSAVVGEIRWEHWDGWVRDENGVPVDPNYPIIYQRENESAEPAISNRQALHEYVYAYNNMYYILDDTTPKASYAFGLNNVITNSGCSTAFGEGNYIHDDSIQSFIAGYRNEIGYSTRSAIFGSINYISSYSYESFIAGVENIIDGESWHSASLGGRNQIYNSHEAFVTGWQNQIDNGYHSVVFGQGNALKNAADSLAVGRGHNILAGDCITAFGSYHRIPEGAQASNVAILGGSGLTPVASDFAVTDRLAINSRLLLLGDGTYSNPVAGDVLMVEGLENVTGINGSPKSIPKVKWGKINNPKITFTQGGEIKGSITLNQSNPQTIEFDAGSGYNSYPFLTNTDTLPSNEKPQVLRWHIDTEDDVETLTISSHLYKEGEELNIRASTIDGWYMHKIVSIDNYGNYEEILSIRIAADSHTATNIRLVKGPDNFEVDCFWDVALYDY